MSEKFGIENLKLVLMFPIEIGKVVMSLKGEMKLGKWLSLLGLIDDIINFLGIDWDAVRREYLDLSEEEKAELNLFMVNMFDIEDDRVEAMVEKSFEIMLSLDKTFKETMALYNDYRN